MSQRSDGPLIRHLAQTYGPDVAREWQRPPLVVLPGEGFVEYLNDHEDELDAAHPTLEHVPWDDVLFDFHDGQKAVIRDIWKHLPEQERTTTDPVDRQFHQDVVRLLERVSPTTTLLESETDLKNATMVLPTDGLWIRCRTAARAFAAGRTSSPWQSPRDQVPQHVRDHPERWLVVEAWDKAIILTDTLLSADGTRVRMYNPAFIDHPIEGFISRDNAQYHLPAHCVRRACPCRADKIAYGLRALQQIHYMSLIGTLTMYLAQANEYLVEVAPTAPTPLPANRLKVLEKKPWLRETLPHFILLDPTRVKEYGHPSAGKGDPAHHASPRPHTRRGHWAELRHERYQRDEEGAPRRVWVKQAWVGDQSWTHEGQRYRVVPPTGAKT